MRKLNNKGVTLVELLVSFSIAAIIVISMFNVVLNYQNEVTVSSIRNDVISYKNSITKMLQTDIIRGNLKSVRLAVSSPSGISTTYTFDFTFNKSVNYSGTGPAVYGKRLVIVASNTKENYITYDDVNKNGGVQRVKYSLIDLDKGCTSGATCDKDNVLKFTSINTNINTATGGTDLVNTRYFKLDLAISHPQFGGDYHINIVAPLNYPYCKQTD